MTTFTSSRDLADRTKEGDWVVLPEGEQHWYIMLSDQLVQNARSPQRPDCQKSIADVQNDYFQLTGSLIHEMAHSLDAFFFGDRESYSNRGRTV